MPIGALKQAKTFLIEACQPEVQPTKFVSSSVFTLKDTILSKHLDRTNAQEYKTPLPVAVRSLKTPFLKLPLIKSSAPFTYWCRKRMKSKVTAFFPLKVFMHVASIQANLSEQKEVFKQEKNSTSRRIVRNTNMAAVYIVFEHQYRRRDVM